MEGLGVCTLTYVLVSVLVSVVSGYDGFDCQGRAAFPEFAFGAQSDSNRVYLSPSRLFSSSLTEAGLVKFVSVFGVRVVTDGGVSDKELTHVGTILAELLDLKEKGRATNPNLVRTLRGQHSMLVIVADRDVYRRIKDRRNRPKELKCFARAFHLAPASAVNLTDLGREVYCPQDEGKKDRSKGLVGDFLVSKGYPATYPPNAAVGQKMTQFFLQAQREGWIDTKSSKCSTKACQEIAFQSWALSSAMGSDTCWCKKAREWAFCTPEEMKRGFPELWGTIAQELNTEDHPNFQYAPKFSIF